jgi:hypothetical protein
METLTFRVLVIGVLTLVVGGCDGSDNSSQAIMTEAQHSHYHVHAADASHEHVHEKDAALGGHVHSHQHPHSGTHL